jgi:hypothetical protein
MRKILGVPMMTREQLMRAWLWLRSNISQPSIDSVIAEETSWAQGYVPNGDEAVYEIISKYAENQYTSLVILSDNLDKKADEHLRFMTTLVGAVTALAASKLVGFAHPWLTGVSLFILSIAFLAAMKARTPMTSAFPMTPRDVLNIADQGSRPGKHQIETVIVASYQVTITGMKSTVGWKARLIKMSIYGFFPGFGLLLGSLIPN